MPAFPRQLLFAAVLGAVVLAGCSAEPDAAPVDPAMVDTDTASMRYSCDDGWSVAVMGDTVVASAADGRTVELQRIADRSPPLFTGGALEFSVEDDGAVLGQDETGPLACRPE
ncbi:hypothetical protein [Novilysobacter arseniciresistens]|nr:hypothetical protein [Lysobacter arseniciresistens]